MKRILRRSTGYGAVALLLVLLLVGAVFGQSAFRGHVMVVKSGTEESSWSATREDTLTVTGGAADTSNSYGQFDTEFLLPNGAVLVTEADSIPDSTAFTKLYIYTRYRCKENEAWTSWALADSILANSYDGTTLVSRKRTVFTWPTTCKPTQVQTRYIATGTGSRQGKARTRLDTW